ncbi:prostaglandin G/H synthase 2-like [Sipha flava]|uniref:Prostaglandin G/H synthase 2-like n=1 Tax=Sipha flava TaxID=143950 RepID=A0A8B8FSQ8_9HEMI|nr:prostaglandin G/H synthase 2-like [Sipha flava]
MADLSMGEVTSNNDGTPTETLTKFLLELSRENAVQSFNNYRRHLGLTAYGSFYQLTGNRDTAKALKLLYGSVENVELMAGMLAERKDDVYSVPTFTVVTKSFIINSILTNPLNSETSWKPETFGGDVGFYLVESANIKNFVCNNLVDKCCESSVDVFIK